MPQQFRDSLRIRADGNPLFTITIGTDPGGKNLCSSANTQHRVRSGGDNGKARVGLGVWRLLTSVMNSSEVIFRKVSLQVCVAALKFLEPFQLRFFVKTIRSRSLFGSSSGSFSLIIEIARICINMQQHHFRFGIYLYSIHTYHDSSFSSLLSHISPALGTEENLYYNI